MLYNPAVIINLNEKLKGMMLEDTPEEKDLIQQENIYFTVI